MEEKHKCKLCFRNFANGRALGGHMRSHMMNLYVPPKPKKIQEDDQEQQEIKNSNQEFSEEIQESEQEQEIEVHDATTTTDSVVLDQDDGEEESETESSKKSSSIYNRRSSKRRIRRSRISETKNFQAKSKKIEIEGRKSPIFLESAAFLEQHDPGMRQSTEKDDSYRSISETTPDEDVAYCLMMLSRDEWKTVTTKVRTTRRGGGKYRCETCKKGFRSYQALGGHRASHKRIKVSKEEESSMEEKTGINVVVEEKKVHECPVCYRVFSSGQALGGHKRSHVVVGGGNLSFPAKPVSRFATLMIDLNLPAPMEDDDVSAVSDAEFVNYISHSKESPQ